MRDKKQFPISKEELAEEILNSSESHLAESYGVKIVPNHFYDNLDDFNLDFLDNHFRSKRNHFVRAI